MLDNSATNEDRIESTPPLEVGGEEAERLPTLASGDKEVGEAQVLAPISNQLEAEAQVYLQSQEEAALKAFLNSTITVVLQLMPDDSNSHGRLGLISVRNDTDPPLFGPPLRGDALAELVEVEPMSSLIAELKRLLPQRLAEREEREKQQEQATITQPAPASAESRKGKKTSTSLQTPVLAEAKSATSEKAILPLSSDSAASIAEEAGTIEMSSDEAAAITSGADTNPNALAKNSQGDNPSGKTVQLTLF